MTRMTRIMITMTLLFVTLLLIEMTIDGNNGSALVAGKAAFDVVVPFAAIAVVSGKAAFDVVLTRTRMMTTRKRMMTRMTLLFVRLLLIETTIDGNNGSALVAEKTAFDGVVPFAAIAAYSYHEQMCCCSFADMYVLFQIAPSLAVASSSASSLALPLASLIPNALPNAH
jgi:hypothetical protein